MGGAVVEDDTKLARLIDDFAAIKGRKLLVHGGGRSATKVASALGIESRMVGGRRITDASMLEVVTMVYGGLVNKNLVARLQQHGVNALGLTGADMDVIRSHRRPPVAIDNSKLVIQNSDNRAGNKRSSSAEQRSMSNVQRSTSIDFGFVGDVDRVNADELSTLIEEGLTPVMAPLTHDGNGNMLNTNADTIASETAKALAEYYDVTLVYAFEKPGVLRNPDDDSSVIATITRADYDRYVADGTIAGGMIPKVANALAAVDAGVSRVIITSANAIDGKHGTSIVE